MQNIQSHNENTETFKSGEWLGRIDAAGSTSVGQRRERNEDNFIVAELTRRMRIGGTSLERPRFDEAAQALVLAVADGVGGYGDGDAASATALHSSVRYIFDHAPASGRDGRPCDEQRLAAVLEQAFRHAETRMRERAQRRGLDPRLGTTLTLAYLVPRRVYLCHVGDSRAYRMREGELAQLTHDHTVAAQLREAQSGSLPDDDGEATGVLRRFEHVLTNAMGGTSELEVELQRHSLQPGDRLLLCSDGLTKHVDDAGLARALADTRVTAAACAELLVRAADEAGGSDNITAVAAQVHSS